MHKYKITITKTAQKQLNKLSDNIADPILKAIANLESNPRPVGYKKLKGRIGYRFRCGDYRIIYDIYDKVLTINVIGIGNRRDIYD